MSISFFYRPKLLEKKKSLKWYSLGVNSWEPPICLVFNSNGLIALRKAKPVHKEVNDKHLKEELDE